MNKTLLTIAERVVVTFALAFLAALPAGALASWNASLLEKAAYAGLFAAVALVQSVLTTWLTGQPQLSSTGRAGAKALA